jgi:hypothetical protein
MAKPADMNALRLIWISHLSSEIFADSDFRE